MSPERALQAVAASLMGSLMLMFLFGESANEPGAAHDAGGPVAKLPAIPLPRILPPIESYATLSETPLFNVSRLPNEPTTDQPSESPAPEPAVPVQPPAPLTSPYRLIGTFYAGEHGIAVLRDTLTQRTVRARLGTSLRDWRLQSLSPRRIVLEQQGKTVEALLPARTRTASGVAATGAEGAIAIPRDQVSEGDLPATGQPGPFVLPSTGQ